MGIPLIYDALVLALAHMPEPDCRHLVVAMTDGEYCGSLIDVERLIEVSKRSEAVLYVVFMGQPGEPPVNGVLAACPWVAPLGKDKSITWKKDRLVDAAEVTGGDAYVSPYGDGTVSRFRRAFDDFRHSYVLRYMPEGVPTEAGTNCAWNCLIRKDLQFEHVRVTCAELGFGAIADSGRSPASASHREEGSAFRLSAFRNPRLFPPVGEHDRLP